MCGFFVFAEGNIEISMLPRGDAELPESASFDIVADCHSADIDSEFQADSLKLTSGTGSGDSHLEGSTEAGADPKSF